MKRAIPLIITLVFIGSGLWILGTLKPPRPGSGGEGTIDVRSFFDLSENSEREFSKTEAEREKRITQKSSVFAAAKDISSPDGFINTDGITLEEHIGKNVVLIDFWTYSCINCQRTLPYLNSWHEKYGDKGLVIIGIHTPEFEFEKEYENVQRAVEQFDVRYPVVLDNDFSTWRAYRNQYWPRKYLIDIDGFIVYDNIGEGGYVQTEKKIVEALNERSGVLGAERVLRDKGEPTNVDNVNFGKVETPEIYLGYGRMEYLANLPSQTCFGKTCGFVMPSIVQDNAFAYEGEWRIEGEQSMLIGDGGALVLNFSANKVNLVAGTAGESAQAEIYLDGMRIEGEASGAHVQEGVVTFGAHDLYNLVDLQGSYGRHELMIKILDSGLEVFAFTFG